MQERYSSPVICLDLVKAAEKAPREIVLRSEFDTAISYINQSVGQMDFCENPSVAHGPVGNVMSERPPYATPQCAHCALGASRDSACSL